MSASDYSDEKHSTTAKAFDAQDVDVAAQVAHEKAAPLTPEEALRIRYVFFLSASFPI